MALIHQPPLALNKLTVHTAKRRKLEEGSLPCCVSKTSNIHQPFGPAKGMEATVKEILVNSPSTSLLFHFEFVSLPFITFVIAQIHLFSLPFLLFHSFLGRLWGFVQVRKTDFKRSNHWMAAKVVLFKEITQTLPLLAVYTAHVLPVSAVSHCVYGHWFYDALLPTSCLMYFGYTLCLHGLRHFLLFGWTLLPDLELSIP